jgi:thiamine-phosphate pyrophosphorylase
VILPPLYAVLDAGVAEAHGWSVPDLGRAFVDGGARLIQLRAKSADAATLLSLTETLIRIAEPAGCRTIVNDRADVARLAGAAGVHVGQDDLSPADARAVAGVSAIVGLSTHTDEQIAAAASAPIDYVAIGPVFGTITKDTGYGALGLERVRRAASCSRHPLVAIGGITLDTALEVVEAGARSVAVISDLFTGGDPAARVREYLRRLSDW